MAWISVHEQLRDHRKTRDLMRRLNCSRQEAIGVLVMLWTWGINNADRYGNMADTTADDIADGIMVHGKAAQKTVDALVASSWLERIGDNHYALHDWDVWQRAWFSYSIRAEKDAERKRTVRGKNAECPQDSPQDTPADCPQDNLHVVGNSPQHSTPQHNIPQHTEDNAPISPLGDIAPTGGTAPQKTRSPFRPPTVEEVAAYCRERCNAVVAQQWHDFYSSKGWMVGKNKMTDWKAAVRTWEKNGLSNGGSGYKPYGSELPLGYRDTSTKDYTEGL